MKAIDEVIIAVQNADFDGKNDALFYLEEMRRRLNEVTVISNHSSGEIHCHDGVCSIDFDSILKEKNDGEAKVQV